MRNPLKKIFNCLAPWMMLLVMQCALGCLPARAADHPVKLGVNIAGSWHMHHTDKLFYKYESWFRAAADLGVQFVDVNFLIHEATNPTSITRDQATAQLLEIDSALRAHHLEYTLNIELANWVVKLELTPGVNEMDHPDGTHRWDLPMDWITALLAPMRPTTTTALIGINFDEGEHNQLVGNCYVFTDPPFTFDKPYYLVTDGMTLEAAYDGLVARAQWLRTGHYQGALRMVSEQVWNDMYHIFARAGWTVAPKLLKESFSSVTMAAALGAALQYADKGADLWVCNDLFKMSQYPGWSPAALHSGLLMSYWLGASAIYVENMDFSDSPNRHPLSSPTGSLVAWSDADHYTVTNHGRVVQEFFKQYVAQHPRPFDWRDYQPRVAIIRLPDGGTGKPNNMPYDRLLGIRNHPIDDVSAEWLKVWPALTRGALDPRANNMNHYVVYPDPTKIPFFVPLDSVAVFDHTVQGPVLDSVRCFIVCGAALSAPTFEELRRRTASGSACCIIARRLYDRYAKGLTLPGDWLIVDDFSSPAVAARLDEFAPLPSIARFRFKGYTVEFSPKGDDLDDLDVTVRKQINRAERKWLEAE